MAFRMIPATLCLLLAFSSPAMSQQQVPSDDISAELQKHFAEAYNRGDLDAMAAAFTEKAIRVTPSGFFEGREAIRRSFQEALKMGLHDYSVRRISSSSDGRYIFNAGEWQAKLGDHPFHGYYTAILVREGDQALIMEETVNVAVPGR